jgi:hypothetical protein
MKLHLWQVWPEPLRSQRATKTRIANQRQENRFFAWVFWLSPQVCFLPRWRF